MTAFPSPGHPRSTAQRRKSAEKICKYNPEKYWNKAPKGGRWGNPELRNELAPYLWLVLADPKGADMSRSGWEKTGTFDKCVIITRNRWKARDYHKKLDALSAKSQPKELNRMRNVEKRDVIRAMRKMIGQLKTRGKLKYPEAHPERIHGAMGWAYIIRKSHDAVVESLAGGKRSGGTEAQKKAFSRVIDRLDGSPKRRKNKQALHSLKKVLKNYRNEILLKDPDISPGDLEDLLSRRVQMMDRVSEASRSEEEDQP